MQPRCKPVRHGQVTYESQWNAAQHGGHWTGGNAPRFLSVFVALSFFRFDGESQPSHLPLMLAVGRLITIYNYEVHHTP
jgi:hypothetical protein